jgi:hypothetical protein
MAGGWPEAMLPDPPPPSRLRDLAIDLAVERQRLEALIASLEQLAERWQRHGADAERVDAAGLRLQSLYTGIERCLLQIVRVLHGGTPEGADWHRRLLNRRTHPTERPPPCCPPTTWTPCRCGSGWIEPWASGRAIASGTITSWILPKLPMPTCSLWLWTMPARW